MKKIASLILSLAMLAGCISAFSSCAKKETLIVCNWGEYISAGSDADLDIIAEFERRYDVDIKYVTAETNETLYSQMKNGGGKYDVIFPSDYMVEKMIKEDMLAKINYDNIPNFKFITDDFRNLDYDPQNEYTVPYFWGTVGIIYNKELLKPDDLAKIENCKDWSILWSEDYQNQIMMFNNPRDAFGIALKQLGYSLNSENENELREAAELLKKQKFNYLMDEIFEMMPSGALALAPYYAGDFAFMKEDNENLGFVIPECGTNIFNDAMCIPKTSEKKELAEKFINFMLEAEIGKANTEYVEYSTPNSAVYAILPEEKQNDKIAYPEIKENWEAFRDLSKEAYALMNDLWADIISNNR